MCGSCNPTLLALFILVLIMQWASFDRLAVIALGWPEVTRSIHTESIIKLADKLAELTYAATHRPVSDFN